MGCQRSTDLRHWQDALELGGGAEELAVRVLRANAERFVAASTTDASTEPSSSTDTTRCRFCPSTKNISTGTARTGPRDKPPDYVPRERHETDADRVRRLDRLGSRCGLGCQAYGPG